MRFFSKKHKLIVEEAVTYRIAVILADLVLLYFVFDSAFEAGAVTFFRHTVQMVMFDLHEQIWDKIDWGKPKIGRPQKRRTFAKTAIYRTLAIVNDMLILLFFADVSLSLASLTTLAITATNSTIYYVHDRLWSKYKQ